ncbi:tryptophan 2,3-dioxygenase family protein [Bradyrhizobium prioriisuperbiae]|uniref:tryptophan 2,3-dioxygenase family protein n=1 Tax=Bradyrhizobium prioriisuperbiae TaxID=2854389 RepID=UPI0028EBE064|nr:tryptophan 2,3-dioxygenase family protein [Bradyrhizobium prioritasuperba]
MARAPVYYGDYLKLDRLLSSQEPESAKIGVKAHDEMLFIIVHQAYELWFKQILHELDRIEADFGTIPVTDDAMARIVHGLNRIHEVLKLTVAQLDVLETMTPFDFLDFRDLLMPASGFQSLQFRQIETRLGLATATRIPFDDKAIDERLSDGDRTALRTTGGKPSLFDLLDQWLARTPFLDWGGATFREAYRTAVEKHLTRDADMVRNDPAIPEEKRALELRNIERAIAAFSAIFSPTEDGGGWRLSAPSVQAALFITLYRDKPAVQPAFRLLAALMDIDETMTLWRYRHALMVERMIGVKIGTGGSSGHAYLRTTAERHRIFSDLFRLSTFLIPRSAVPELPPQIQSLMGFVYAS